MAMEVLHLVRWEWFKLRKRSMPWVLLLVTLLITQGLLWGFFAGHQGSANDDPWGGLTFTARSASGDGALTFTCQDIEEGRVPAEFAWSMQDWQAACQERQERHEQNLVALKNNFVLPTSLYSTLGLAHAVGAVLMAILMASSIGGEYGWGTVRTGLVRGTGRTRYLASKGILLALLGAAGLLITAAATVIASLIASAISGEATRITDGAITAQAVYVAKAWVGLLPYMALAFAVTVLTASSAAGMGITLCYYFLEPLASTLIGSFIGGFETVSNFLVSRNLTAWMVGSDGQGPGHLFVFAGINNLPGPLHAFLVLISYSVLFVALALLRFKTRDITGAA